MEHGKSIRNVAEIDTADRQAIEHLIGGHLAEDQQIIISIVNRDLASPGRSRRARIGGSACMVESLRRAERRRG